MVIPDPNLLIHAYNRSAPQHARAKAWWEGLLNGDAAVLMPWAVTLGFIRLMSHRAVLKDPMPVSECLARVQEWFTIGHVVPLDPGARHWTILSGLLAGLGVGGNLVTDAHLAALAIEHNAELHSNDADFARFAGLRVFNPLG